MKSLKRQYRKHKNITVIYILSEYSREYCIVLLKYLYTIVSTVIDKHGECYKKFIPRNRKILVCLHWNMCIDDNITDAFQKLISVSSIWTRKHSGVELKVFFFVCARNANIAYKILSETPR